MQKLESFLQFCNCEYAERLCSPLLFLVSKPVTLFYFKFWRKYHFSIQHKHLAFAHWSKNFKDLILSQIIVLLGKLNVSVRDGFTHFRSRLFSFNPKKSLRTASPAKRTRRGGLSTPSQSRSSSTKAGLQTPSPPPMCVPWDQTFQRGLEVSMGFRSRME